MLILDNIALVDVDNEGPSTILFQKETHINEKEKKYGMSEVRSNKKNPGNTKYEKKNFPLKSM